MSRSSTAILPILPSVRWFAVLLVWSALAAAAEPETRVVKLSDRCTLRLLNAADGRAALAGEKLERYTDSMSPLDIEVRLGGRREPFDRAAALTELRKLRAESVRDWTDREAELLTERLRTLHAWLEKLHPGLVPTSWDWVKTTGAGEAPADGYTVDGVVVVHEKRLAEFLADKGELAMLKFLAHETFHVLSRTQPELRRRCYRVIGHEIADRLDWGNLEGRRLTNPDGLAPAVLKLTHPDTGEVKWALPAIYSPRADRFDDKLGSDLFAYLGFGLFEVRFDPAAKPRVASVVAADGKPPTPLEGPWVKSFSAQIGSNTGYIIHADEVLADNFALLLLWWAERLEKPRLGRLNLELLTRLEAALQGD